MTPQQLNAMKQALEALESCDAAHITDGGHQWHDEKLVDKAITAIKKALAEHAMRETQRLGQEIDQEQDGECKYCTDGCPACDARKLPAQRTWVGLKDEEIDYFIVHRLTIATKNNLVALIRICEAKLKEKNT